MLAAALTALIACAPAGGGAPSPADLVISGARVVDVDRGVVTPPATVVIRGRRILSVDTLPVSTPAGARRLDATGLYLIPGLWDLHVHLGMAGREVLPLLLEHGVTGVRDMGGPERILAWRDSIATGTLAGPRIVAAGTIVESKRWLDAVIAMLEASGAGADVAELRRRFSLDTPADAQRAVDSLQALRADFVKIRNYPSAAATFALFRAARTAGLPVAGHPPPASFLGVLSDSGLHSFEHEVLGATDGKLHDALGALPGPARDSLFARLASNHTAWVPTLATAASRLAPDSLIERVLAVAEQPAAGSPARLVTPTLRSNWRAQLTMRQAERDTLTDWRSIFASTRRTVRQAAAKGVSIGAGTDLGVPLVYPGLSLHEELERLVREVGLPPREALAAATTVAAGIVGLAGRSGLVAPGAFADLVLLGASPLAEISAIRDVRCVITGGATTPGCVTDARAAKLPK